jgi:hypothetical protein
MLEMYRHFKQQSALCTKYDIYNLYKYFMVHDNEFCQFSLFTASFPENFQLYFALWCVIWGHGDNTTSDPSHILPTVFFWSWKRVDNHYFLTQAPSFHNGHPCHAHHKTRTNTIETNKVAHMKTLHTNKKRWLFCVFVVVLRLNSCGLQVSIFETRKTRLQSHTMGINPINIKKSELYSNLNWIPTTNSRVQKTNVLQ